MKDTEIEALKIAVNMAIGFCVNARETWSDWEDHEEIGILFARLEAAKSHPTLFVEEHRKRWLL